MISKKIALMLFGSLCILLWASAKETVNHSANSQADEIKLLFGKAILFEQLGQFSNANKCYEAILDISPTSDEIRRQLKLNQDILSTLKKIEGMEGVSAQMIADSYNSLGILFEMKKSYDKAIASFTLATQYDPNNVKVFLHLGQTYRSIGEEGEAEKNWRKVIDLDNDKLSMSMAYTNIGMLYEKNDIVDKAKENYKSAIALNQNYFYPHSRLGDIYLKEGQLDKASELYTQVVREGNNFPMESAYSLYGLSRICAIKGDEGKSLDYLEGAFEKGFRGFQLIEQDDSFKTIRRKKSFVELIRRYKK